MAEIGIAQVISEEEALRRFIACAICIGYCFDSNRAQLVDDFQRDIYGLHLLLGRDEESRLNALSALVATDSSPWVRYHAAIFMWRAGRQDALAVLEELDKENGGMYSPLACAIVQVAKNAKR